MNTGNTSEQAVALSLWCWYQGEDNTRELAERFCDWIASSNSEIPISAAELQRGLSRIRQQAGFAGQRSWFIQRWQQLRRDKAGVPTTTSAMAFINDWLDRQDHGLIFNLPIISGLSRITANANGSDAIDFTGHYYERRDYWILHATLEGRAIYSADRDVVGEEGDLILIAPEASCYFCRHPQAPVWLHSWTLFRPQASLHPWMSWPEVGEGIYRVTAGELMSEIKPLMKGLRDNPGDKPYSAELAFNLLQQVFIRVAQASSQNPDAVDDPRVEKAMAYLRQRCNEPLKMAEVAEHCHVSLSRLSHLFKAAIGMSLQDYRSNLRMQEARRLLATTPWSIQRVAETLAYRNAEQLSKAFAKHQGCSPREFRNLIRH